MYLKRNLLKILLALIVILNINISLVFADDNDEEELNANELQEIVETSAQIINEPVLNSKAAIIYDRTTKKIMWGKNENTKRAMASTTKIMTAIIVIENSNLNDIVTISKKSANTGGSRLKISTGDKITVNDLLYGLMLRSGNDAAVALAEYVGGSVEGFAKLMNDKAKELELNNTHFVTPHGLDNPDHYTTAYELAILTDYALQNPLFAKIVNTKTYTLSINGNNRTIGNTNELLGYLDGVDGVKTGFTGNAMRCLVTSCTRNGNQIITVVLGADTKKQRTQDSIKLINYAFSNYERVNIEEVVKNEFENWKQINESRIYINKAKIKKLDLDLGKIEYNIIPLEKGKKNKINIEINCIYQYEAPVEKGIKVGNIIVKCDDEILDTIDIITKEEVRKKNVIDYLLEILGNLPTCLDFYS